jgi:undecaprenyl-diphosphatase
VAIAVVVATMAFVDTWAIAGVQRLPLWVIEAFDRVTGLGRSVWFLVPIGLLLVVMAALASPSLAHMSRLVLAAVSVRLAFLFVAIGLPGLVFSILKRLIGRARPLVDGSDNPFVYRPLGWSVEYASLPSGHATDACAAAFAIGTLWPRTRAVMWTYALVIGMSRVMLTSHHPSDVLAGAIVGVVGALIVRDWFAARRLGFVLGADGSVRMLPGPSWARIKRVARTLAAQ